MTKGQLEAPDPYSPIPWAEARRRYEAHLEDCVMRRNAISNLVLARRIHGWCAYWAVNEEFQEDREEHEVEAERYQRIIEGLTRMVIRESQERSWS